MTRIILSIVAFAILILPALAGDVKIEGETKVKEHKLVRLSVPAPSGAGIIWDIWPDGKADLEEDGAKLIFTGPPGEYTVKARVITIKDGKNIQIDSGKTVVTIEGVIPPGPVTPPTPDPNADPLYKDVLAAYNQEPVATRKADVKALAAVYRQVSKNLGSSDSAIKTAGDLFFVEVAARKAAIEERLPMVRAVTNAGVESLLPGRRVGTPLDSTDRAAVQLHFNHCADVLDKLP